MIIAPAMALEHLPHLTIEFLEANPDGLRLITQSDWVLQCLTSSRTGLAKSIGNSEIYKKLDVPGVYLLIGPSEHGGSGDPSKEMQLYVGQGDSVADRLTAHLRNEDKKWFRNVFVLRRTESNPLNLTHCKFLESKLCSLASDAGKCILNNRVAPQLPVIARNEQTSTEDFLEKSLIILGAFVGSLFQKEAIPEPPPPGLRNGPEISPGLIALLDEIRLASTGPSFPNADWYATADDYRAKCMAGAQFRVFIRVKVAKNWFRLQLKDVGIYKVSKSADLNNEVRKAIEAAYQKAEQYLQRNSRG